MTDSQLIDAFGGTGKLAERLELDKSTVSCWRKRGIPKGWKQYLDTLKPAKKKTNGKA